MNMLVKHAARLAAERFDGDDSLTPLLAKVLLHDGILYALEDSGLLRSLVFQGGTAIQRAYGGTRLSEDLDFVCGQPASLSSQQFQALGEKFSQAVQRILVEHYGIEPEKIIVSQPKDISALQKNTPDIQKWSIKIVVSERRQPNQVVKVEVANIPAHDASLRQLSPFAAVTQYPPVLAKVESLREILADKAVALCCRPYLKYRDIYDITYIEQQNVALNPPLVLKKLEDYHKLVPSLLSDIQEKQQELNAPSALKAFNDELSRFISSARMHGMSENGMLEQMLRTSASLLDRCKPAIQDALENMEAEENPGPSPS